MSTSGIWNYDLQTKKQLEKSILSTFPMNSPTQTESIGGLFLLLILKCPKVKYITASFGKLKTSVSILFRKLKSGEFNLNPDS